MGGGGQSNSGQASTAAAQQTAANSQDMALSKQYGGQEAQIFSKLFGTGGGSGTLSQFLDPANLDQKGLNSNYKTQFNEGSDHLPKDTPNNGERSPGAGLILARRQIPHQTDFRQIRWASLRAAKLIPVGNSTPG